MSFEYSNIALGSLKFFDPVLSLLLIKNWYLASYGSLAYKYILSISGWLLLNLIMHLLFQIPSHLLLTICMNDLKYTANLNYVNRVPALLFFHLNNIKINHLCLLSISLSHTLYAFAPYEYVAVLSNDCNLLSYLVQSY